MTDATTQTLDRPTTPDARLVLTLVDDLPAGLTVNAGALLGITLGRLFPEVVGHDVTDASGVVHPGISTRTVPVLKASTERLAHLAGKARATPGVTTVDVTDTAQRARTYDDYARRLADGPTAAHRVLGLALHGPETAIRSLTGDLPLYR